MNNNIIEEAITICNLRRKDYFDEIIGQIEDIVMEKEFQNLQKNFFEHHYNKFETGDENKLIYTEIFKEYTNLIETYIVHQLTRMNNTFDMEKFSIELQNKRHQLDGDIFEMLLSLVDFIVFKELILDYKAEREGKFNNVELGITVTKIVNFEDNDEQ